MPPSAAPADRLVAGVATLGAVVLLAGVGLSVRGPDPASRTTTVSAGAVVVTAEGTHTARRAEAVPQGAQVRAVQAETLTTAGRVVTLAPGSAVTVLDGARQRLDEGSALVDARRGDGLALSTSTARLTVPQDSVSRLDGGDLLRVASYRGPASVGVPGRRSTTDVPALHQLEVPAGSTPGRPTALGLRDGDPWEQDVLAAVVANDESLERLVRDFSVPGSAVVGALPQDLRDDDPVVSAEHALAVALAGSPRDRRYAEALALRAEGGSWGVVAALVEATVMQAERYAAALSGPDRTVVLAAPVEGPGAVLATLEEPLPPPVDGSASAGQDAPPPAAGPGPRPRPTSGPSGPPGRPAPAPSPTAGATPAVTVLDPVLDPVLGPVLDLLPVEVPLGARPTPTASRTPQAPVVGSLVDGLLAPAPAAAP